MRVLITGITGFAARHLTERLCADGHEVFGTSRQVAPPPWVSPERVAVVALSDRAGLTAAIRRIRPDGVFHLAAATSVAASFADPDTAYHANLLGSLHVFAAVHAAAPRCRVLWVGSSDAYGLVSRDELPVRETALFRPLSPYAVSKAAADLAAFQGSRGAGLDIVRVRPFNHTGPGQTAQFVCADFARQVVEIERGRRPARIDAGNLDVERDFTDVRDVVRAYVLAWERGERGEAYNVCTGIGRTPRAVAAELLRIGGVDAAVVADPQRQRPVDVPVMIGSAAKIQRATGWSPAMSWEQTLRDVLADWRARLVS